MPRRSQIVKDPIRIVYIHGNGNKPPEGKLKEQWDMDLFEKLLGDSSRMAYWADIVHGMPGHSALDANTLGELISVMQDATLTEASVADSIAQISGLTTRGARLALSLSTSMLARAEIEPAVLPLPRAWRRAILRIILQPIWGDVDAYLLKGIRKRYREGFGMCCFRSTGR